MSTPLQLCTPAALQPSILASIMHSSESDAVSLASLAGLQQSFGSGQLSLPGTGRLMATAWGQVDFIGGAQHMKQLISAPFTGDPVSLALHRVGDSILLGSAPLLPTWEGGSPPAPPPSGTPPAALPSTASPPWAHSEGAIHLFTNSSLPPLSQFPATHQLLPAAAVEGEEHCDPPMERFDPPSRIEPTAAASSSPPSYAAAATAPRRKGGAAAMGTPPPPPLQGDLEKRFVLQTGSGVDTVSHLEEHVLPLVQPPRMKRQPVKLPSLAGNEPPSVRPTRGRSASMGMVLGDGLSQEQQEASSSSPIGSRTQTSPVFPEGGVGGSQSDSLVPRETPLQLASSMPELTLGLAAASNVTRSESQEGGGHALAQGSYTRVTHLQFQGVSMVLGSDLLTFRHSALPAPVSLAFVPEGGHLQPRQVLDWYLDNLLAGLSHTAVSTVQRDGRQQYTLVRTQDIPEWAALYAARTAAHPPMPSGFTATAVQARAAELLQFIKQTCMVDGGSYWLLRRQGDAELHLLQVTAAAQGRGEGGARGSSSTPPSPADDEAGRMTQLQWAYTASSVCSRLARQVAEVVAARASGEEDDELIGSAALRSVSANSLLFKHVRLLSRAHEVASKAAAAAASPADIAAVPRGDGSVPLWVHMPWKRHYRASLCMQLVQGLAWQGIQLLQGGGGEVQGGVDPEDAGAPGSAVDALNTAARYALWGLEMRRVTLRNECWGGVLEWTRGGLDTDPAGETGSSDHASVARMVLSFPPVRHGVQQVVEMQTQLLAVAAALARGLHQEALVHSAVRVLEDALTAMRVPLLSDWSSYCSSQCDQLHDASLRTPALSLASALHDAFEARHSASARLGACLAQPVACEWLGVTPPGSGVLMCPGVGSGAASTSGEGSAPSGSVSCSAAFFAAVGDVFTAADLDAAVPRAHGVSRRAVQWSRLPTLLATLQQHVAVGSDSGNGMQGELLSDVLQALKEFRLPDLPEAPTAMVAPAGSRGAGKAAGTTQATVEATAPAAAVSAVSLHVMAMHAYSAVLSSMPSGWRGVEPPHSEAAAPPPRAALTPLQFLAVTQVQRKMADCCNRWGQRAERPVGSAAPGGGAGDRDQVLRACVGTDTTQARMAVAARLCAIAAFSRAALLMDSCGDELNAALGRCNIAKVLFAVASMGATAETRDVPSAAAAGAIGGGQLPLLSPSLVDVLPPGTGPALALMDTACELVQAAASSAAAVEARSLGSHRDAIGQVRVAATQVLLAAGAKLAETAYAASTALITLQGGGGQSPQQQKGVFDNDVFTAAQRLSRAAGARLGTAGEAAAAAVAACRTQFTSTQNIQSAAALANSQLLLATVQLQTGMAALAAAVLGTAPGLLEKPLVLMPEGARTSAARAFGRAITALADSVRPLGVQAPQGGGSTWSMGLRKRCAQLLLHSVGMLGHCALLQHVHLHLHGQDTAAATAAVPCSAFPPPLSLHGLLQACKGGVGGAVRSFLGPSKSLQRDMTTAFRGILLGTVQPGDLSAHIKACMNALAEGGVSSAHVAASQRETAGLVALLQLQTTTVRGKHGSSQAVLTAMRTYQSLLESRGGGTEGGGPAGAQGGNLADSVLLLFPVSAVLAAMHSK